MNIRAGLGEYILQTHNTNFFEDSLGGFEPPNPPPLWVRQWDWSTRGLDDSRIAEISDARFGVNNCS